jgi:hypothetical protein
MVYFASNLSMQQPAGLEQWPLAQAGPHASGRLTQPESVLFQHMQAGW